MPSVHIDFAPISRGKGHSAIKASAYASRSRLYDPRTNQFTDFSNHPDKCLHSEIMLPTNAPKSYADPETLWLKVEEAENRKDARLARRVIMGLPHELNHNQRIQLMRDYIQDQFISKGMIAEFAVHEPHNEGDKRNYHAHILLTTRKVNEVGFWTSKTTEWNAKSQLLEWRNQWFNAQNRAYARAGHNIRIDPRTLKIQHLEAVKNGDIKRAIELDRKPEIHIGRKQWTGSDIRQQKNLTITQSNFNRIENISQILRTSNAQQKQIERILTKRATSAKTPPKQNDPPPQNPTSSPSNAPTHYLNDLFNQYGGHLSLPEKITLASAYADMILNIRAGRNREVQKNYLIHHSHKVHQKAQKRLHARQNKKHHQQALRYRSRFRQR